MGNIVLLVSREEMLHQAHNILQEKNFNVTEMKVITTEESVLEARKAIAAGASIIITRGLQASLIKQYADIPVVEIVITAQEMALLVVKAKQIIKTEIPVIAVVGFRNMFCDMSYFDEIYNIQLRAYYATTGAELTHAVRRAISEKVDLIIGGDTAVALATEAGIPSLFLSTTEDSMRNALAMAESMEYAMRVEKKNNAQMETLLDYSFSGVVRMDKDGKVTVVNRIMEDMLECSEKELIGNNITKIFPDIDKEKLAEVLSRGEGTYSLFIEYKRVSIYAILAPVQVEGGVIGAILSCHKMKKKPPVKQEMIQNNFKHGLIATGNFAEILQSSENMKNVVSMSKLYSKSEQPVLIIGETGTERRLLAQSIHNSSFRNEEPFVMVSCEGLTDESQKNMIFGEQGALVMVNNGTMLIEEIDKMTLSNQYSLFHLIRYKLRKQTMNIDVRVIATTKVSLAPMVAQGSFLADLYYVINGLSIVIPPLRDRREDLKEKIEMCINVICERYSRYHVLTSEAKHILMEYTWPGNILQVENFLERLILTANKRSIDETTVSKLLDELYPNDFLSNNNYVNSDRPLGYSRMLSSNKEAQKILSVLEKYDWSRYKTAEELKISKATLWRKMQKYQISKSNSQKIIE